MPRYQVVWEERMSVKIEAKNKEEARELVLNGEVEAETSELSGNVEAYEMKD